jgi:phytoene dehydrogenase-like protein
VPSDVVVIGAGVNGLVAGAWLAKRGVSTIILDRRPVAGGAAITTEFVAGFRVPSLSHALGPLHRDVVRGLRLDRVGLEFITPDPSLTTIGREGQTIVLHRDPVLSAASIHPISTHDAVRWREFLRSTARITTVVADLCRQPPPTLDAITPRELWQLMKLGRHARALGRRDLARLARWLPMSVADLVGEWFESDLLRAAICARAVFGNFVGPRSAGTGAMLLQRLAEDPMPVGSGVTVRGGPGALSQALVRVAEKAGAQVRTNARVVRVTARDGRVTGVVLESGEELAARAVVAAVDPRQTLLGLVDPEDLSPTVVERIRHYRVRGVTAKVNLALSALPTFAALHGDEVPLRGRFLIAPDVEYLERAFDAAKYGELSPEPWLELSLPTIADPALAPDGRHVLSAYVHFAPRHLRGTEWATQRDSVYRAVMRALAPHAPGFESLVIDGEVLTPEDLEQQWGLSGGHIFHGEPTLDQFWVARPILGCAQYRTPIRDLYLASAGTHPGGGLTGLPGLLAAKAAAHDLRATAKANRRSR